MLTMLCSRLPRSSVALLFVASLAGGCVIPKSVGDDPSAGETSSSGDTDGPSTGGAGPDDTSGSTSGASGQVPTTTSLDTSGATDPAGSDDTGFTFIMDGDGGIYDPCDPWLQNCPNGEKCVPWANDGGDTWNTWRCSPVVEQPDAVGEPCTVEGGPVSGIDTCDFGAYCWDVAPGTVEGTCVSLCTGAEDSPVCPDGDACFLSTDEILTLCLPSCDPLLQDCGPGHACYPAVDGFACVPEGLEGLGEPGDECQGIAACNLGNVCVPPEQVPDCIGIARCCTALCTVGDPMPSCLPGQGCEPWFEAGMAPAGYEDVGVCRLP